MGDTVLRLFAVANNNVLNGQHIEILRRKRRMLFHYLSRKGITHYNNLIRSGDLVQLEECRGMVSLILCGGDADDGAPSLSTSAAKGTTLTVRTFEAAIPRKKWTHLAIVASDKQNANRVALYMVHPSL